MSAKITSAYMPSSIVHDRGQNTPSARIKSTPSRRPYLHGEAPISLGQHLDKHYYILNFQEVVCEVPRLLEEDSQVP
jgi:hypothetical protein